jgi:hypothetical protein
VVYPTHYRAVIEGGFFDGSGNKVESWSTSIRIGVTSIGTTTTLDAPDFIDNELTTFCNTVFHTIRFNGQVKVDKLSMNQIGPDGRYVDQSTSHFKILSGTDRIGGDGSSTLLPLQTSVVATLRSAKDRGPASHGRMFLPVPQVAIDSDWKIRNDHLQLLLTDLQTGLGQLSGSGSAVTGAYSFFPALVSPKGTGSLERITRVGVGRVLDTMRSRRRSLPEAHAYATLS